MKIILLSSIIILLYSAQTKSVSKFGNGYTVSNYHITNDSLSSDSLRFCPSSELVKLYSELSNCCCIKDDCTEPISESGLIIVNKGINMVIEDYKISGSCWSFVNKVYELAGFPSNKRALIYKNKKGTLIKDTSIIHPGDWLYHVNYSFHNVEHSAIFICWKDYERRIGITLGHVGQNKYAPGRFGEYDLRGVYQIYRGIKD